MQNYQTDKIDLVVKYDIITRKTSGIIYSKIENTSNPIPVATIEEEPIGSSHLCILPNYNGKSYIKEEYEKVKSDFVNYAKFWHSRASRGIC